MPSANGAVLVVSGAGNKKNNGVYTVIDEAQDYSDAGEWQWTTYEDYYQNKIAGPVPDFFDINWHWCCKAEETPRYREPFDPPRKGRRGWNQPKPHHHLQQHRPRMNYKRRRRHG